MIKKLWLLSLLAGSSLLQAEPVDLLQQLYGQKSPAAAKGVPNDSTPAPAAAPETLTLTLRDSLSTQRERIFLSDVASCSGSKRLCDDLQGIDLGSAPKPMHQDRWTKQKVQDAVAHEAPELTLEWKGAEACQISALSSPVNEEAVTKVLDREFAAAPKGMRIAIQSVRLPIMPILRHTNYLYRVPNAADQVGRVFANPRTHFALIKMEAVDQDPSSQATIEFAAQVSLRVEIQAVVANEARERGERLAEGNVVLDWIPYQDQVVTDAQSVIGKSLKVRLLAKQAIRPWDLTRDPEVQRGERVEAVINNGGVKLNSVAQALEPGFIGQKIRIRLESTKKNLLGTVIARSQVEVPSL